MAKKRGGLAGFYDRNKKIIKPVAAGLAGMLGTPALGAAVGAAFGGLDREGKKGIGVDLGGAAKGGLAGYAAGSAGQSLGKLAGIGKVGALEKAGQGLSGGLKNMLTGGKSAASGAEGLQRGTASMNKGLSMLDGIPNLTGAPQIGMTPGASSSYGAMGSFQPSMSGVSSAASASMNRGLFPDLTGVTGIGSKFVTPMPAGMPSSMPTSMMGASSSSIPNEGGGRISNLLSGAGKAANKLGGYVERNKAISELGVKGLLSQLPNEESAIARQRLDLDERKFDMTEQQVEEERERRRYVMQYLRQQYPQYFQNG